MDKLIEPVGFPSFTFVGRERLLPLRYDLRTFEVKRLLPLICNLRTLGVHCPGVADENRCAVEGIVSLEYAYIAFKLADHGWLNHAFRECIVNPVDTPKTRLAIVGADGHSDEVFPVAGLPVINIADTAGQRTPFITGDEIHPFMGCCQALL